MQSLFPYLGRGKLIRVVPSFALLFGGDKGQQAKLRQILTSPYFGVSERGPFPSGTSCMLQSTWVKGVGSDSCTVLYHDA